MHTVDKKVDDMLTMGRTSIAGASLLSKNSQCENSVIRAGKNHGFIADIDNILNVQRDDVTITN